MGFNKKSKFNKEHWIYFADRDLSFYRVGFYDNIRKSDKLSIYVEIGLSPNQVCDIDKEKNRVLTDLKKVGIIDDHELVDYEPIIMNPAYVHIETKSQKLKEELKIKLKKNGIYLVGRYGDWKYCSIEDSMLDSVNVYNDIIK